MDRSILEKIHTLLAKDMLQRLEEGGLEAKDWTAIAKFIKDNGVDLTQANIKSDEDVFGSLVKEAETALPEEFRGALAN